MSDYISRADAIEAVEHIMRRDKLYLPLNYKERRKALVNAITMIKKCPSDEAEWIPCSDRLPSEKDGEVLVTKCDEVRIATYSEFSGTWYVGEMCAVGGEDPIAWKPKPEPYRKDGEDYKLATEQMEHDAMYEPTYSSEDGSM